MFKRIMLALTFMAAFSSVGVGLTNEAHAWRSWGRPYGAYYYGPPRGYYSGGYAPYRAYYAAPYPYYRPRVYAAYPYDYYPYPDSYYYYGPRSGVSVSFGF